MSGQKNNMSGIEIYGGKAVKYREDRKKMKACAQAFIGGRPNNENP